MRQPYHPQSGSPLSFDELLQYLEGNLSRAEKQHVEECLANSPTDRQALEGIRLFLEQEQGGKEELRQYLDEQEYNFTHIQLRHRRQKVFQAGRWALAASVLLAVLFAGWLWQRQPAPQWAEGQPQDSSPALVQASPEPSLQPQEGVSDAEAYREGPLPRFSEAPMPPQKDSGQEPPPVPAVVVREAPDSAPRAPAPVLTDFLADPVPTRIEKTMPVPVATQGYLRMIEQLDQLHAAGSFTPDQDAVLLHFGGRNAVLALRGSEERVYFDHGRRLRSAVMSPDGKMLVTSSDDRTARLWSRSGEPLATFSHRKAVFSAIFSPDSKSVLTTSDDNSAHLWDLEGKALATFAHKRPVLAATFSPDGERILTASDDNTARLWDRQGTLQTTFSHERAVFSAVFSPDGQNVLTASDDNSARLWNLEGSQLALLPHNRSVRSAVFAPDGKSLLTASWDKTARLWELSGKMRVEFRHSSWVYSASFSPDGSKILTTSDERAANLWDVSGTHLARLAHEELVISAVFSPDGQRILTSSRDQVSRFWTLEGASLGEIMCPC